MHGINPQQRAGRGWLVLLLGVVLFSARPGNAQAQSAVRSAGRQDSLLTRLREPALPDSVRAVTLYQLCWELRQSDLAAARRYGEQGLTLSRRIGYWNGELSCLAELSSLALSSEDYLRAEQRAQELVRRAAQAPARLVRFRARGFESIATVATVQGQHARAAQYYRQQLAIVLANQPALTDMLPMTYLGLASTYYTQLQEGNRTDSIVALNRYYARQAQRLARQARVPLVEAASLQLLAMALKERGQLDSADRSMQRALALYRANNATYNVGAALVELAGLSVARARPAEAVAQATEAQRLAHAVQDPCSEMASYDLLGQALAQQGQGLPAYRAVMAAQHLRDSVQTAESQESLHQLQVKFDTERKEGRIHALTQQQRLLREQDARQRQGLWGLGAVLATVVAGLAGAWALAGRLRRSRALLADQNRRLSRARTAQDHLYAIVAHDLRGPLTAFQALAPMIRYYCERGETAALDEIADEVSVTADQLTRLLDNLLHYATTQAGELGCCPEVLTADALLTDIATLYAPVARAGGVILTVSAPSGTTVSADRTLTLTVLRNLTHNALKIAPPGSVVALAARPMPDGRVGFTVTDQGPGLLPERVAELLGMRDPGQRSGPAGAKQGTGLGLPLVRRLVQQQKGEFTLISQPGVGTVARVMLPGVALVEQEMVALEKVVPVKRVAAAAEPRKRRVVMAPG